MGEIKVYSPSQTRSWLECPRKRQYEQVGFEPLVRDKLDAAALVGQAVHTGLNRLMETSDLKDIQTTLHEFCEQHPLPPGFDWSRYDMAMVKVIDLHLSRAPLSPFVLLRGATRFSDYGNCELDAILTHLTDGHSELSFVDYKVKLTIYGQNADQRRNTWSELRRQYELDWQMMHYTWVMQRAYDVRIQQYAVEVLALEPKPDVQVFWYPVDWTMMEAWMASTPEYWKRMQQEEFFWTADPTYRAPIGLKHYDGQYKRSCKYLEACTIYNNDYSLMRVGYSTTGGKDNADQRENERTRCVEPDQDHDRR